MNTLENVKQWFIDRDLENGGRLDKQSLKLSEEFGELCAGYLKKNEKLTKDSIGDCAVVIVGLALLVKTDVHKIFEESCFVKTGDVMECFKWLNTNIDVKYRVNKEKAMTVFSNYTTLENVNDSVVSPAVQRAIESVTGNYDIYDILGNKRTEVYEAIDKALKEKFESYDLEFVSFTITDQDAGDEIEAAIKNESVKQKEIDTAKQEQEKAKVEADTKKVQAQAEADAGIIKAEGEAKANKAKSDSITDNLIRMKEAEAREKHGWVTVNGAGGVITNHE